MEPLKDIRERENRLLLGVTGGIASGKTTVALMLSELGARIIDFDALSRVVVEPGTQAWKEIVAYFGKEILLEDQTINREKLSKIVFQDPGKRKKLESFIHPRIYDLYLQRLKNDAYNEEGIIISVIIPLLFEVNLQNLFHKVLLVYVPQEVQIERLMKRDHLSREEALNRLKSQLPIEGKRGFADFIVDNSGSLEDTKQQLRSIWKKLKEPQKLGTKAFS